VECLNSFESLFCRLRGVVGESGVCDGGELKLLDRSRGSLGETGIRRKRRGTLVVELGLMGINGLLGVRASCTGEVSGDSGKGAAPAVVAFSVGEEGLLTGSGDLAASRVSGS